MKIGTIYFSDAIFLAGYGLWWQIGWAMSQYHTVFFMNERYLQFGALGGFSKREALPLNIIWLSTVWIICNEHNDHIFQHKEENLQTLCEKIKLLSYWWLKSKYVTFDFDYHYWRLHPQQCLLFVF